MNSFERFQRRLAGEAVDRPPNFDIFVTFAAHHIGEPLSLYYQDYRVLAEKRDLARLQPRMPAQVYRAATRCMRFGGPRSFSTAGCEIPLHTPYANLHAQARALREL
jgi:hypothetical protein